jgi:hypothetical protein
LLEGSPTHQLAHLSVLARRTWMCL